jgi:hypothetical protein
MLCNLIYGAICFGVEKLTGGKKKSENKKIAEENFITFEIKGHSIRPWILSKCHA